MTKEQLKHLEARLLDERARVMKELGYYALMPGVKVGAGEPVLLLHGWPTSSYLWRNIAPSIAEGGRGVIALVLPNFTTSAGLEHCLALSKKHRRAALNSSVK